MNDFSFFLVISLASVGFCLHRLRHYLRFFQQEDYRVARFLKWVWDNGAIDSKGFVLSVASSFMWRVSPFLALMTIVVGFGVVAFLEGDPRKKGKLKLKMTERATRLLILSFILLAATEGLLISLFRGNGVPFLVVQGLLAQGVPLFLGAAGWLLSGDEKRRQAHFISEATTKLKASQPFVIGITGSYGKTSTKNALAQILQTTLGPTFWPKEGVNNLMGIVREIRENLSPYHDYAVIEMGAHYKGTIARVCSVTPPQAALVTCVGEAHLERFGSVEGIYEAKSELPLALQGKGILVCNGDNAGTRRMAQEIPSGRTLLYGFDNSLRDLDCWISQWETGVEGTHFYLNWKEKTYEGKARVWGQPALSNLAGAFTMAVALGADPHFVLAVMASITTVDNRLELLNTGPVTYIRDAYNSNPVGFDAALKVMRDLPAKRRILMTPGMIELGHRQTEANTAAGRAAAAVCDIAIVVGDTNKEALLRGMREGGLNEANIKACPSRDAAFKLLESLHEQGDVVLIENDLPDLYEKEVRF